MCGRDDNYKYSRAYYTFVIASLDELVRHGLHALRDTLQQDKELNTLNCSIGIVGVDHKFKIIEGDELQRYLDLLDNVDAEDIAQEEQGQAAPMDTEA